MAHHTSTLYYTSKHYRTAIPQMVVLPTPLALSKIVWTTFFILFLSQSFWSSRPHPFCVRLALHQVNMKSCHLVKILFQILHLVKFSLAKTIISNALFSTLLQPEKTLWARKMQLYFNTRFYTLSMDDCKNKLSPVLQNMNKNSPKDKKNLALCQLRHSETNCLTGVGKSRNF